MTVIVSAVISSLATAGVVSGVAAGAAAGAALGAGSHAAGLAAGGAAGAAGASASAGAVLGAVVGGGLEAAAGGALSGIATSTLSSSLVAGAPALISSPLGWLVLGADVAATTNTFDCWKPVLRDRSPDPSGGMMLREVAADVRIKRVTVCPTDKTFPEVVLQNVWDESFRIEYVAMPTGDLATHAVKMLALEQ